MLRIIAIAAVLVVGAVLIAASGPGFHMLAPMEGRNVVEFLLEPEGSGEVQSTRVSWAIQGPMPYISKVLSLFCDMDAMIGKEFESGLAELKAIAER